MNLGLNIAVDLSFKQQPTVHLAVFPATARLSCYFTLMMNKTVLFIVEYANSKTMLIQQHVDKSNFFDRSWNEFRAGFGTPSGNFWLGNERIHQLTKYGECRLRFDLQQDGTSVWYQTAYTTFIVADEQNDYQLTVGGYIGDVYSGEMASHNGNRFVTHDRDLNNCAVNNGGGFWYNNCGNVNVNAAGDQFKWYYLQSGVTDLIYSRMWLECP